MCYAAPNMLPFIRSEKSNLKRDTAFINTIGILCSNGKNHIVIF